MMLDEILLLDVGIVASILTLILLIVLAIMYFRHRYIEPEQVLKHIKAKINRIHLLVKGRINYLILNIRTRWTSLRTSRQSAGPAQAQLAQLPEGIKVIKQNSTRPLTKPCPNCQK